MFSVAELPLLFALRSNSSFKKRQKAVLFSVRAETHERLLQLYLYPTLRDEA